MLLNYGQSPTINGINIDRFSFVIVMSEHFIFDLLFVIVHDSIDYSIKDARSLSLSHHDGPEENVIHFQVVLLVARNVH